MELLKIDEIHNLMLESEKNEDDIICSMVYKFAKNLPYSIDYLDEDFTLGDFINYIPSNSNKYLFKDYGSIYNKMINWSDTLVSGIQLQVCNIFQKMLISNKSDNYNLSDEDYYNYGFDKLTSMEYYNKSIFNLLRRLPYCVKQVNVRDNVNNRRKVLDDVYKYIWDVTNYVVKNAKEDIVSGNVVIFGETVGHYHRWKPSQDLEMTFYFERIEDYILDCSVLINYIKDRIHNNRGKKLVRDIDDK